MRFALFPLSLILISVSFGVHATMYKWVDDEGQMHFGDKIPAKYLVKEHQELNEQGVTTRHRAAAKTDKERAIEKLKEKEKLAAAKAEKKKRQRDRVLLDTYTTESDLVAARDSRLEAVDTQIRLSETIIGDSNKKIEALEKKIASIEASNRAVPDDVHKQMNTLEHQSKVHSTVKHNHVKRRDEISVQFDGYIERFRVLIAEKKARRERIARERAELYK